MKFNKIVFVSIVLLLSFACNLLSPSTPSDLSTDLAATQNALQLTQISIENLQNNDSANEPTLAATDEPTAAESNASADESSEAANKFNKEGNSDISLNSPIPFFEISSENKLIFDIF